MRTRKPCGGRKSSTPLAAAIAATRLRLGWTQWLLAESVGCKREQIAYFETGRAITKVEYLLRIAAFAEGKERELMIGELRKRIARKSPWVEEIGEVLREVAS